MKVEPHSATWKAVENFIDEELADCMTNLVADRDSEQMRGAIKLLDRLSKLREEETELVASDDYLI